MRVAFSAIEPVWMSVSSDGAQTYSGMLEGQQSKEFDASRILRVLVGNAGGLIISLNKPVPQIGEHGQIRLLELTAEGARACHARQYTSLLQRIVHDAGFSP
jgi:hypothetical protein